MVHRVNEVSGRLLPAIISTLLITLAGCSPKSSEILVAKVGETPITLGDYETLFVKSNGSLEAARSTTQEERETFLGLMTNFRLKLTDAYREKLDKRADVIAEINQYKGSLAQSYLTEREVTAPGVKDMFDRRMDEIRASHILLNLATDASPEDSAIAYNKALDLIRQLKAGANFETLAREHSQDPSVQQNGGDLYYFTGGQMVPAFEDAAFSMKVGDVTPVPVRTQFGLHIIKVTDRKPSPGERECSHIMIRFDKQDPAPEDTLEAYAKISAIKDSLNMGMDFAELAMRNSGDPGSSQKGGDLGWFTRRRWVQPFDEVAMSMQPGQISPIVRTVYGYHLIKCTGSRPPKPLEEVRKDVQQLYQQVRFQEDYRKYLTRLKRETGYALNDSVASLLIAAVDTNATTRDTAWASNIPSGVGTAPLFSFRSTKVSVDSVVSIIKSRPDMASIPLRPASIRSSLDKVGEQLTFEVKAATIERDYPEFAEIMREYVEGILLYQIEQERVWNRIAVSDTALRGYYEHNKEKFAFPDRVDYHSIRISNDSVAHLMVKKLRAGKTMRDLFVEDSLRMKSPSGFQALFTSGSSTLSKQTMNVLDNVAGDMTSEAQLRVTLTGHHDTLGAKGKSEQLAVKRLDAARKYLMSKHGIAENRISTLTKTPPRGTDAKDAAALFSRIDIDISGRRPLVIGTIENNVAPVDGDERADRANSLSEGEYSDPLQVKNAVYIVRLNKREPARLKTFEEAGTEVSSAFQEYESKRLEREWLDGLRKIYPVVEYKETLKTAFAPNK